MSTEAQLSPYVTTLEEATVAAVRSLLGAPDSVDVSLRGVDAPDDRPLGELRLAIAAPSQPEFELTFADPTPDGWISAPTFSARVSMRGGQPEQHHHLAPLVRALKTRVAAHGAQDTALWRDVRVAWAALRPFAQTPDTHFRWLGSSGEGRRGMLRLGFRCNQDCSFCWQRRDWPEPPAEWFFRWLEEFAALGLDHLFISGGEPTTWKRLPELVERAAQVHGMQVLLQTNAIALSSSKYLTRLRDAGLSVASVSLHAATAELSDAMTRAPGTFERTLRGIAACRAAGLPVHLTCVVERTNLGELPAHAQMIVDRFMTPFPDAPRTSVAYAHPCLSADHAAFEAVCPSLDEVRGPLAEATRILVGSGALVTSVGGCGFPACALHDAPDLLARLNPADLLQLDTEGRTYGYVCDDCAMKPWCIGLRKEYVRVHGGAGLRPFDTVPPLPTAGSLAEQVPTSR